MEGRIRIIGKEGKGESQFAQPRGVCINTSTKEIFIVDCNNHRIQVLHLYSLAFIRQIGKGSQGNSPGSLTYPVGIDIDQNGHIFVADTNNHRIVVFNHLTGSYIRSIGSQGSNLGCLNCPYGVCVDTTNGQLFVADYENNRIQVFDSESSAFLRVIGEGHGSGPGQFNQPIDVCIDYDQDFLLVADYSNNRVQILNKESGEFFRSLGSVEGVNAMNGPRALCINRESGLLFISDRENHRIQMFEKNTFTLIRHIGLGYGMNPGMFNRPMELCVDNEEGVLIVVDGYNHRIQILELPELRKEKLRIRSAKRNVSEIMKDITIFPSSAAIMAPLYPQHFSVKEQLPNYALLRVTSFGEYAVCAVLHHFLSAITDTSSINSITSSTAKVQTVSQSFIDNPIFRQANTFLGILNDVSTSSEDETIYLVAPSLLALYSLMKRGWSPIAVCNQTVDRLVYLLSHLQDISTHFWERQSLLESSVELLRESLSTCEDEQRLSAIFSKFLLLSQNAFDTYDLSLVGSQNNTTDAAVTNSSKILPSSVLFSVLYLISTILHKLSSSSNQRKTAPGTKEPAAGGAYSKTAQDVTEMLLGPDFLEFIVNTTTKRRRTSNNPSSTINNPITTQRSISGQMSRDVLDTTISLPLTFSNVLEKTFAWKRAYKRRVSTPDATDVDSHTDLRDSMLTAFADHIDFVEKNASLYRQNKENRSRGGRNIWDPSRPIAVGDLVDCMDKEKSWFESLVIEVNNDGSIRIHFLGWGTKWDDNISEPERSVRVAPLNTHTRNWRSDLFEGGLIEIKCNDDMVNQKWMWGRITQLNVEESWIEVAYSFSNEPLVVKKAWLYSETICPVGMHTKDKSKAAAALITRPGKTVKEIAAEKMSMGRNDVAFYDLDDDFQELETINSLSVTDKEVDSLKLQDQALDSPPTSQSVHIFPWIAQYLFHTNMEEIATIVAQIVGCFLSGEGKWDDSTTDHGLLSIKNVVEAIARTSWRDSLPKYFVKVLYLQASMAAKCIALPVTNISVANDLVLQQVLDLADRLMQLYQLFCKICNATLTTIVCAPTTKEYIQNKLQATINHSGFMPVANEVLSAISKDAVTAHSFFSPFQQNQIVYSQMKRYRNFFRCLINSGGKKEVEKLYEVMEEEIISKSLDKVPSPLQVWKQSSTHLQPVYYFQELVQRISESKNIIDGGWMSFARLVLSPERLLIKKLHKFDASESLAFGKCLAFALNQLMSPKTLALLPYPAAFVSTTQRNIMDILLTVGYDEILYYFSRFFLPLFFFRIIQSDYASIVEEKGVWKELGIISDAVEGIFNQMELFEKLNSEFSRYLLMKLDDDNSADSQNIDEFLMDAAAGNTLSVHLFKDNQVPGAIIMDTFSSLQLPPSVRRVVDSFANFCHGHGVENASRIRWCLGLGRMELSCTVYHRSCFNLIVNEPQFALLHCLANYSGKSEVDSSVSIGRLAYELNISHEAVVHIISSMVTTNNSGVQLLTIVPVHEGAIFSPDSLISLPWKSWIRSLPQSLSPWTEPIAANINLYDQFWQCQQHAWHVISSWRESTIDACILRQLKLVLIRASQPGMKDTISEMELANKTVHELMDCYKGHIFREEEVMLRAKLLRRKGMICSSLGMNTSVYKTPDVRYSYFSSVDNISNSSSRLLTSRRSNSRPGLPHSNIGKDQNTLAIFDAFEASVKREKDEISSIRPAAIEDDDGLSAVDGESKQPPISSVVSSSKVSSVASENTLPKVSPLLMQQFLMNSFASLSIDHAGSHDKNKPSKTSSIMHLFSTASSAVATALATIVSDLNTLLATAIAKNNEPLQKLCIDMFLSQIHSTIDNALVVRAFYLPIVAGLSGPHLHCILRSYANIVVSDMLSDVIEKLQQVQGIFPRTLSLLNDVWNVPFSVEVKAIASFSSTNWGKFFCLQLGITGEEIIAATTPAENSSTETFNDVANDQLVDETAENKTMEEDNISVPSQTVKDVSCTGTSAKSANILRKLSLGEYINLLVRYFSTCEIKVQSSSRRKSGATELKSVRSMGRTSPPHSLQSDQTTHSTANVMTAKGPPSPKSSMLKKKPSKFLSEMGPAIDRLPQLAQHRPSSSARQRNEDQQRNYHSSEAEDKNGSEEPNSRDLIIPTPSPLSVSTISEDKNCSNIIHSPPPSQRSWIEDPVIRYSQQQVKHDELVADDDLHLSDMDIIKAKQHASSSHLLKVKAKSPAPTAAAIADPLTPLLVDLSDAIPNYAWDKSTPTSGSTRKTINNEKPSQVWHSVIDPLLHVLTVHCNQLFEIITEAEEDIITSTSTNEIATAMMDTALGVITTSGNSPQKQQRSLWWMNRPINSVFDVLEDGLSLVKQTKDRIKDVVPRESKASFSAISLQMLATSIGRLDEINDDHGIDNGSSRAFEDFHRSNASKYCCRQDAFDTLITLQTLEVEESCTQLVSRVSSALSLHWSVTMRLLSLVDWDVNTLLEEYFTDETSVDIMAMKGHVQQASSVLAHYHTEQQTRVNDDHMICFSCASVVAAEDMYSLGCCHFACKGCWTLHIQKVMESSSEKDDEHGHASLIAARAMDIVCQRNESSLSSASSTSPVCSFVGGAELVLRVLGDAACEKYLRRLYLTHEANFKETQQRLRNNRPSTSTSVYFSLADPESLSCQLCVQQQQQQQHSHSTQQQRMRHGDAHPSRASNATLRNAGNSNLYVSRRLGGANNGLHPRKLADISPMTVAMVTHASQQGRIQKNIDILKQKIQLCTERHELNRLLRQERFWRLFWDCQLLLDHNLSMSGLDLDLLRQLKDLLYKQLILIPEEEEVLSGNGNQSKEDRRSSKERKQETDITEETLLAMVSLRKKLRQLYDYPDSCNSRLVLAPTASPHSIAANTPRGGVMSNNVSSVWSRASASSALHFPLRSQLFSSRSRYTEGPPTLNQNTSIRAVLVRDEAFPWPIRKNSSSEQSSTNFDAHTCSKTNSDSLVAHINGKENVGGSTSSDSFLNQPTSPKSNLGRSNSMSVVVPRESFSSTLEQLQAFASMDKVSLYVHLFALRDSLMPPDELLYSVQQENLFHHGGTGSNRDGTTDRPIAEAGFAQQRQWLQLIDLVQYPRHDAASLGLTLLTLKLFATHCHPVPPTNHAKHPPSLLTALPVTEELIHCLTDILLQHQEALISFPTGKKRSDAAAKQQADSSAVASAQDSVPVLTMEDSVLLVRQCCHLLRTLSLCPVFVLQTSIEGLFQLFDALVQLLYLMHHVDDVYQLVAEAAVAILDLSLLHNRRSLMSSSAYIPSQAAAVPSPASRLSLSLLPSSQLAHHHHRRRTFNDDAHSGHRNPPTTTSSLSERRQVSQHGMNLEDWMNRSAPTGAHRAVATHVVERDPRSGRGDNARNVSDEDDVDPENDPMAMLAMMMRRINIADNNAVASTEPEEHGFDMDETSLHELLAAEAAVMEGMTKVRISDLPTIDLIDALVTRHEDLHVLRGTGSVPAHRRGRQHHRRRDDRRPSSSRYSYSMDESGNNEEENQDGDEQEEHGSNSDGENDDDDDNNDDEGEGNRYDERNIRRPSLRLHSHRKEDWEECDCLDDLLCAVMLRVVAASRSTPSASPSAAAAAAASTRPNNSDSRDNNNNNKQVGDEKEDDSETVEAVFALPAVFSQLISALHRHTSRILSIHGTMSADQQQFPVAASSAHQSLSPAQRRLSQSIICRALQVLIVLLQRARDEHLAILTSHFSALATALRELCHSFLISVSSLSYTADISASNDGDANIDSNDTSNDDSSNKELFSDLLFPLTMQLIALGGAKYDHLRRAMLTTDISDSLFFLHDTWRQRHIPPISTSTASAGVAASPHTRQQLHQQQQQQQQQRQRWQGDMMQLAEAIQVLSEGAALGAMNYHNSQPQMDTYSPIRSATTARSAAAPAPGQPLLPRNHHHLDHGDRNQPRYQVDTFFDRYHPGRERTAQRDAAANRTVSGNHPSGNNDDNHHHNENMDINPPMHIFHHHMGDADRALMDFNRILARLIQEEDGEGIEEMDDGDDDDEDEDDDSNEEEEDEEEVEDEEGESDDQGSSGEERDEGEEQEQEEEENNFLNPDLHQQLHWYAAWAQQRQLQQQEAYAPATFFAQYAADSDRENDHSGSEEDEASIRQTDDLNHFQEDIEGSDFEEEENEEDDDEDEEDEEQFEYTNDDNDDSSIEN